MSSTPAQPAAPAWSREDLAANPHARSDKPDKVRSMFAAIAPSYDLNNRLHSFWRDQAWRRFAIRQVAVKPTDVCLDVACGTGDLTEALARAGAAKVTGLDFTPQMLDVARVRAKKLPPGIADRITYIQGDAQNLPLADASVDVITIAFGIRNVLVPAKAIAEFRRVLRPGGRLAILEFSEPTFPPARWFNRLYTQKIMPFTATLIARDKSGAYKYLPKSVETFLGRGEFVNVLRDAGFRDIAATPLTMGVCMCYAARA
ncbi:MAG TPA: bifunctional demethylmenaquinone methyltransferase/2-methoxy-6-polyprenyl-1,4-benzoquinol methylase UbiE [Phycisphaerales bacterium]|nr:bifunctional demethylmenaquinone methyltransferase/2-methoxy-6-polyprenyl-1,4-benzoquinol methylase UbiE [Phycisphaerales bacterium]